MRKNWHKTYKHGNLPNNFYCSCILAIWVKVYVRLKYFLLFIYFNFKKEWRKVRTAVSFLFVSALSLERITLSICPGDYSRQHRGRGEICQWRKLFWWLLSKRGNFSLFWRDFLSLCFFFFTRTESEVKSHECDTGSSKMHRILILPYCIQNKNKKFGFEYTLILAQQNVVHEGHYWEQHQNIENCAKLLKTDMSH